MKNTITGSVFESALRSTILDMSHEERNNLPLGIVLLEKDGTLSSIHVPANADDDSMFSMLALEYIRYSFDRNDWMSEFITTMEKPPRRVQKKTKLTLIKGGANSKEE